MKLKIKFLSLAALLVAAVLVFGACATDANTAGMRRVSGAMDFNNPLLYGVHIPTNHQIVALPQNAVIESFVNGFVVYVAERGGNLHRGVVDVRSGEVYHRVILGGLTNNGVWYPNTNIDVHGCYHFTNMFFSVTRGSQRALFDTSGNPIAPFTFASSFLQAYSSVTVLNENNLLVDDNLFIKQGGEFVRVLRNAPYDLVSIGNRLFSYSRGLIYEQDGSIVYAVRQTGAGEFADRFILLSDTRGAYISHRIMPQTASSRDFSFVNRHGEKVLQTIEVVNFSNQSLSRVNSFNYDLTDAHTLTIGAIPEHSARHFSFESRAHMWTIIYGAREISGILSLSRYTTVLVNDRFTVQESFSEDIMVLGRSRFIVLNHQTVSSAYMLKNGVGRVLATFTEIYQVGDNVIVTANYIYDFDGNVILYRNDFEYIRYVGQHFFAIRYVASLASADRYEYLMISRSSLEKREIADSRETAGNMLIREPEFGIYATTAFNQTTTNLYNYLGVRLTALPATQTLQDKLGVSWELNRNNVDNYNMYFLIESESSGVVSQLVLRLN